VVVTPAGSLGRLTIYRPDPAAKQPSPPSGHMAVVNAHFTCSMFGTSGPVDVRPGGREGSPARP